MVTETLYVGGATGYDQMFARATQAFIPAPAPQRAFDHRALLNLSIVSLSTSSAASRRTSCNYASEFQYAENRPGISGHVRAGARACHGVSCRPPLGPVRSRAARAAAPVPVATSRIPWPAAIRAASRSAHNWRPALSERGSQLQYAESCRWSSATEDEAPMSVSSASSLHSIWLFPSSSVFDLSMENSFSWGRGRAFKFFFHSYCDRPPRPFQLPVVSAEAIQSVRRIRIRRRRRTSERMHPRGVIVSMPWLCHIASQLEYGMIEQLFDFPDNVAAFRCANEVKRITPEFWSRPSSKSYAPMRRSACTMKRRGFLRLRSRCDVGD